MNRYKLLISYDGTGLSGWQIQPNSPTVQEHIQRALSLYCREEIRIIGSGRTDAGVHATGQVAHFNTERALNTLDLSSLNAILPNSIVLRGIEAVSEEFHALFSARAKTYTYHIYNDREPGPFIRPYVAVVWDPINIDLLNEASQLFVGRHDFTSFANVCKHRKGKSAIRNLFSIKTEHNGPMIKLTFYGEGFLYKMVRNIVGGLILASTGKITVSHLQGLMEAKERNQEIPSAPASGLFLRRVDYVETQIREALRMEDTLCPIEHFTK